MGTSTPNSGPNSSNPLIPTWLDNENTPQQGGDVQNNIQKPDIKPETGRRFSRPRNHMNNYFRTGDTQEMKNGVGKYVRNTGGSRASVKRMGSSTKAAGNLLSFLSDVKQSGTDAVAKSLNLSVMPNETAEQFLLRVSDHVCEVSTSNIPDAVTRTAYVETVIEMTSKLGVDELEKITDQQIQESLGLFIGKSVTERIINDICNNVVAEKANPEQLQKTLQELGGYIEGCASDAISNLTSDGLDSGLINKIDEIYSNVFEILESCGGE